MSFVENVNKLATSLPDDLSGELASINSDISALETNKVDKVAGSSLVPDSKITKLDGIATGATANSADATLLARGNHTGTQSLDTITETATKKIMTDAERTKLAILDTANPPAHIHPISNVSGLQTALDGKAGLIHTHDDRYYTESETDTKLALKSDTTHTHSDLHSHTNKAFLDTVAQSTFDAKADIVHTHDDRYFTESEVNSLLSNYATILSTYTKAEVVSLLANKENLSNKGIANGYVPLGSDGTINPAFIGSVSVMEVFTASSQTNMLGLSGVGVGDLCVRSDLSTNNVYLCKQTPSSDIDNWIQLSFSATVASVNGYTGIVTLTKSDIGLGNVDNTSDANKPISTATQTALNNKADTATTYTKAQVDTALSGKSDSSHTHAFSAITSKPTTISGYDITDAYTKTEINTLAGNYVPKTTTVNGHALSSSVTVTASDVGLGNVTNNAQVKAITSTANKLVKFSDTSSTITNSVIYDDGTNIGIGTSSGSRKLNVLGAIGLGITSETGIGWRTSDFTGSYGEISMDTSSNMRIYTGSAERMRIDSSGNVGIGVTPSAWTSGNKALDIKGSTQHSLVSGASGWLGLVHNAHLDATLGWVYNSTTNASFYFQNIGKHEWYTAPSGTAGNAITWTTAMTLSQSGAGGANSNFSKLVLDNDSTGTGTNSGSYLQVNKAGTISGWVGVSGVWDGTSGADLGIAAGASKSLKFYTNNSSTAAMTLDASGDLTVPHTYSNTTASAANMYIDSAGKFYRSTSSVKYKTNIEDIDSTYINTFFEKARPIYYKSLSTNDNPNWGYWGFIAEEIAEFDPRLVHWRYQTKEIEVEKERVIPAVEEVKDEDGNITKEAVAEYTETYTEIETINDLEAPLEAEGVQYERIVVLLTAKVQELETRLKALEAK